MFKQILITLLLIAVLMSFGTILSAGPAINVLIYLEFLQNGNYKACYDMSSPEMQAALPPEKLKETWESLLSQVGEFQDILQTSTEVKEPYQIHTYSLEFEKLVLDMQITIDDLGVVSGLFFRPSSIPKPSVVAQIPEYLNPEGITLTEVKFDCEGHLVNGIFTVPSDAVSYPVVLMLSGSGPNDMDETVGQRKPFRDIGNGLAKHGIATIRWNKRTRDYPQFFAEKSDFTIKDEYLPEVNAALQWLKANHSEQITHYYLLGHSLGGMILPMAAAESKNISGFIMLAANARPLEDLVVEQYEYIFSLEKMADEKQTELDKLKRQAQEVKQLDEEKPASQELMLGVSKAYWLSLNYYRQTEVFRKLNYPFLILQGEKDYQVTMQDFALWKSVAEEKKNVKFKSYPNLDHLFMYTPERSTPDSYMQPAFVSEQVILDIANWINRQ